MFEREYIKYLERREDKIERLLNKSETELLLSNYALAISSILNVILAIILISFI